MFMSPTNATSAPGIVKSGSQGHNQQYAVYQSNNILSPAAKASSSGNVQLGSKAYQYLQKKGNIGVTSPNAGQISTTSDN